MAFCLVLPVSAQKKTAKVKKAKTSVNVDSLEVRKLIDEAKKGDAESQNTLGTYYYTGKKVKQNYDVALKWFSMAGKQKHVKAIANMGLCYQLGHVVEFHRHERFCHGGETLQGVCQGWKFRTRQTA